MARPKLGGEIDAMIREAAKDVNATFHQVFFGQTPGASELGTPMAPTQAMVNEDLQQSFEAEMRAAAGSKPQERGAELDR